MIQIIANLLRDNFSRIQVRMKLAIDHSFKTITILDPAERAYLIMKPNERCLGLSSRVCHIEYEAQSLTSPINKLGLVGRLSNSNPFKVCYRSPTHSNNPSQWSSQAHTSEESCALYYIFFLSGFISMQCFNHAQSRFYFLGFWRSSLCFQLESKSLITPTSIGRILESMQRK